MPLIERLAGHLVRAGSFFSEKVYVKATFAYNAFQLIQSATQLYHPKWARSMLMIQRYCIVLDAAYLAMDACYLYKKLGKSSNNPSRIFRKQDILPILAFTALTAVVVAVFNAGRFRPADDLTEILKKVAPPETIKNVTLDWEKPWLHAITQWISLNRCFFQGFSYWDRSCPVRKSYLTNAGLQLLHFLNISRLPFLKYQQVVSCKLNSREGVSAYKVEHSFYFLVASLKDSNYLPSAVQAIHHFCTGIVDQFSRTFFFPPPGSWPSIELIFRPIPNSLCSPPPLFHHLFRKIT
jgi:hypothetical protein